MGRIRQINGHVIYFPGPAEDTGNLIAATCLAISFLIKAPVIALN
jgi:hypothetical protein